MSSPSNELVSYISTGLAAGKTPDALRAELKTVGWADADVEAAFVAPAATPVRTEPNSKTTSLISWKPIVIAIGAVVIWTFTVTVYSLGVPANALLAAKAVLVLVVILLYSDYTSRLINRLFERRGSHHDTAS